MDEQLGKLYFPINVYGNHWILILVDKPAKEVVVFDSIAYINQYHVDKIFDLVKMSEDSTSTWKTFSNSQNLHIQRQKIKLIVDILSVGMLGNWQ